MAVTILDQMQMLDQQITPPRERPEQGTHVIERARIDLPALGGAPRPAAATGLPAICVTV
jgi:hypothetical protein